MTVMDDVLKALADPSRRLLLDSLNGRDGQSLRELCTGLAMARQSVRAIAEHWIEQYDRAGAQQPPYDWTYWREALDHP